jgi:hypothetical protein
MWFKTNLKMVDDIGEYIQPLLNSKGEGEMVASNVLCNLEVHENHLILEKILQVFASKSAFKPCYSSIIDT